MLATAIVAICLSGVAILLAVGAIVFALRIRAAARDALARADAREERAHELLAAIDRRSAASEERIAGLAERISLSCNELAASGRAAEARGLPQAGAVADERPLEDSRD